MHLSQLQPSTFRKSKKRVGRGGKRGTFSGGGTKGQKSRAGASVRPGFRGGDNRIWQLFPKQRGAKKKPGGSGNNVPHRKHRFFQLKHKKPTVFNLGFFNQFTGQEVIDKKLMIEKGFISNSRTRIKVLGDGELKRKIDFDGFEFSKSAKNKVFKFGGTIK